MCCPYIGARALRGCLYLFIRCGDSLVPSLQRRLLFKTRRKDGRTPCPGFVRLWGWQMMLFGLLLWQNPVLAVEDWLVLTPVSFSFEDSTVWHWVRLGRDLCQFTGMQVNILLAVVKGSGPLHTGLRRENTFLVPL